MLEARKLGKKYGGMWAVTEVEFAIRSGEVMGYLGPNGSGKSTTVGMLTGLLHPSRGQVIFDGENILDDLVAYKRRLGYVPEIPQLYPYLSGREYLQLTGRLRGLASKRVDERIDELLQLLGLGSSRFARIASYSKGMRQKVLIAAALLHNPDVLIFDEPLSGLDVTTALVFRDLIQALAKDGKTILYSSHVLEVVEKVCSHVIILHKGRMVANDTVERLRGLMQLPSLEEIFTQLVEQENTEHVAANIVEVMKG